MSFPAAEVLHHLVVVAIDRFAVLALVREERRLLLLPDAADVHVIRRAESHRLIPEIHFEEIDGKSPLARHVRAHADSDSDRWRGCPRAQRGH